MPRQATRHLLIVLSTLILLGSHPTGGATLEILAQEKDKPQWITPAVTAPQVAFHTFESRAAKTRVSFHLYLPEAYHLERDRRFPVLYWLHGTGGGLAGIAPLSAFFDRAIREGRIPPMIVAFPNGLATSMWGDSKDGSVPMETILVRELLPHIDSSFRTIATAEGRVIEGFSMGGYGAARLGFRHPDLFGAVSILAGGPLDLEFAGPRARGNPIERERVLRDTFSGDLDYFKAQSPITVVERSADKVRSKLLIRIVAGARDNTMPLNRDYSKHLDKLGIPHAFDIVPGAGHDTRALLDGLSDGNWTFYRAAFGGAASRNLYQKAAQQRHAADGAARHR